MFDRQDEMKLEERNDEYALGNYRQKGSFMVLNARDSEYQA